MWIPLTYRQQSLTLAVMPLWLVPVVPLSAVLPPLQRTTRTQMQPLPLPWFHLK
jgi:hypothetical protein